VVAIYVPQKGWTAKAYDNVKPGQGLPEEGEGTGNPAPEQQPEKPAPQPTSQRR
jgi:hypothetical protein